MLKLAVLSHRIVLGNRIWPGFSGWCGRGGQVREPIPLSSAAGR